VQLTHIRLLVSDYDACFRFYRDVMGFEVLWGAEGEGYADFKAGDGRTALALFERQAMAETLGTLHLPAGAGGQDRLSLIFGVENLDATAQQLQQKGVEFVVGPTDHPDWGIKTAHFRDPDGNLIEINSPIPHSEWTEELKQEGERYA
jgi:lactoylglutathione lyase